MCEQKLMRLGLLSWLVDGSEQFFFYLFVGLFLEDGGPKVA